MLEQKRINKYINIVWKVDSHIKCDSFLKQDDLGLAYAVAMSNIRDNVKSESDKNHPNQILIMPFH